jgi:hypothetical protein
MRTRVKNHRQLQVISQSAWKSGDTCGVPKAAHAFIRRCVYHRSLDTRWWTSRVTRHVRLSLLTWTPSGGCGPASTRSPPKATMFALNRHGLWFQTQAACRCPRAWPRAQTFLLSACWENLESGTSSTHVRRRIEDRRRSWQRANAQLHAPAPAAWSSMLTRVGTCPLVIRPRLAAELLSVPGPRLSRQRWKNVARPEHQ